MKKIIPIIFLLLSGAATLNAGVPGNNRINYPDSTLRPYLIAFVAEDVEKTAAWYKEKLNFEIIRKLDFPAFDSLKIIHMKYGNSEVELELIQKKSSFSIKKYVPDYDGFDKAPLIGFSKIAFEVKDAAAIANKLKTMGVKFLVNLYDDSKWGLRSFIVEDIDGNVLQFNQKL